LTFHQPAREPSWYGELRVLQNETLELARRGLSTTSRLGSTSVDRRLEGGSEASIRNHTRPGQSVYDPFLGSGTCLVAAETLGRRCYAMEFDAKYVQLSVERWQGLTGETAERVEE
jgi:hypothetical protein